MKDSTDIVSLAVDSVGIFVGMLGWGFAVWAPLILAFVLFCMVKVPAMTSVVLLIIVSAVMVPSGLLLRWLSSGIIERGWARIVLSVSILVLLGIRLGFAYSPTEVRGGGPAFDRHLLGVALFFAAAVVALGLTRPAECPHE
jgi:hypothetical protein